MIEGLDEIRAYFRGSASAMRGGSAACMVFDRWATAVTDALVLLKEQEATAPIVFVEPKDGGKYLSHWYGCGACKVDINKDDKYCHNCGKAVKWE